MAKPPARRFFRRTKGKVQPKPQERELTSADDRPSDILFFDIESTDLNADIGTVLTFGWKFMGEKESHSISLLDFNPVCKECGRIDTIYDTALMREAAKILSSARIWISWYGKRFDIPMLQSRMLDARLRPLPPVDHIDLWQTSRTAFKLTSNRLANVQQFLQLAAEKTPLEKRIWRRAGVGVVEDIEYVNLHCRMDVDVLEGAYEFLRPYIRNHPKLRPLLCRTCGSDETKVLLEAPAAKSNVPKRTLECQSCGAYEVINA